MIRHVLTLIWNKKRSNFLLFVEIFASFLILFAVFSLVVYQRSNYTRPLGFDTENTWVVNLRFSPEVDSAQQWQAKQLLKQELASLPAVERVGFSGAITPFSGGQWTWSNDENGFLIQASIYESDLDYPAVAGLNIVAGRAFRPDDLLATYPAVLVNQQFLETYFPGRNMIDSIVHLDRERRIVGVVDHFKYRGDFAEELEQMILLTPPESPGMKSLHLRLRPGVAPTLEEEIYTQVAQLLGNREFSIEQLAQRRNRENRSVLVPMIALLSICGFLVINVALGLFGILWYNISKRRAEIGLRRTLGASRGEISGQFLLEIYGVVLGAMLCGAVFAVQFPWLGLIDIPAATYYYAIALSLLLISGIVLLCAYYPSRQAARVHPAVALHEE